MGHVLVVGVLLSGVYMLGQCVGGWWTLGCTGRAEMSHCRYLFGVFFIGFA